MSDEKDLGKELLRQNGIEPGTLPEDRRKELRKRIERDKARAMGAKFGIVGGPLFVLVIYIVRKMLGYDGGGVDVMTLLALGLFSLVFIIVSLYFIGMYFGQREMQTTLTDLSIQLEQLAKNQQTDAQE